MNPANIDMIVLRVNEIRRQLDAITTQLAAEKTGRPPADPPGPGTDPELRKNPEHVRAVQQYKAAQESAVRQAARGGEMPAFDRVWNSYPVRVPEDEAQARVIFDCLNLTDEQVDQIQTAIERFGRSQLWQTEPNHRPLLSEFLLARTWEKPLP